MVWTNASLVAYHGTDESAAANIIAGGVDLHVCPAGNEFGKGFYVTTCLDYARGRANEKALLTGNRAAVIAFAVDRGKLCNLDDHLTFIIPNDEYFEFCTYNSLRNIDHARGSDGPYDVVYGPVKARLEDLVYRGYAGCDQICFLTTKAVNCLPDRPLLVVTYGDPYFPP